MRFRRFFQVTLLLLGGMSAIALLGPDPDTAAGAAPPSLFSAGALRYQVEASHARLNRKVTGPVTVAVRGIPAEPVDSFVYNGDGSTKIDGTLLLEVDPIAETGLIFAEWVDPEGREWSYVQTTFIHPEHLSGVRMGTAVELIEELINEGVTHNVYLHGNTRAGMPVLPTVFNHLATWGPADVTLDGEPFENPFELPAPQWLGHMMVTEGVRGTDGTVRVAGGEFYTPAGRAEGVSDPGDLEVHLVFHDERFPRNKNHPPIFSFFYHLVFEDVVITIRQSDDPTSFPSRLPGSRHRGPSAPS